MNIYCICQVRYLHRQFQCTETADEVYIRFPVAYSCVKRRKYMNRLLHINKVYPSFDKKPLWQVSEHIISFFLKKLINIFA